MLTVTCDHCSTPLDEDKFYALTFPPQPPELFYHLGARPTVQLCARCWAEIVHVDVDVLSNLRRSRLSKEMYDDTLPGAAEFEAAVPEKYKHLV